LRLSTRFINDPNNTTRFNETKGIKPFLSKKLGFSRKIPNMRGNRQES